MGNRLVLALLIVATLCLPLSSKAASAAPWPTAFQTTNPQSQTGNEFGMAMPGNYITYICSAEVSNAVYGSWNEITESSYDAFGYIQYHTKPVPTPSIAKSMVWNPSNNLCDVPAPTSAFPVRVAGAGIAVNAQYSDIFDSAYGLQRTLGLTIPMGSNTMSYSVALRPIRCDNGFVLGGCNSVSTLRGVP